MPARSLSFTSSGWIPGSPARQVSSSVFCRRENRWRTGSADLPKVTPLQSGGAWPDTSALNASTPSSSLRHQRHRFSLETSIDNVVFPEKGGLIQNR